MLALEAKFIEAMHHHPMAIRYFGYKPIDVDGIPWTVCPEHKFAHPVDFPCKFCCEALRLSRLSK